MAGVRSSKEDFKNYYRLYNTLCSKATFDSIARKFRKVFHKPVPCYVQGDRDIAQVRCGRELRGCERVPIKNISNTQEKRKATANLRFTTLEPISQTPEISSDKSKSSSKFYARRRLSRKARYQPSLFSYPSEKESSKIPCVRLRESGLSNDIFTFRPVHCTNSLFQCQQVGSKFSERKGSSRSSLLGRLPICTPKPKHAGEAHALCSRNFTEHGLVCQSRKIRAKGHTGNKISGNYLECIDKPKDASKRQDRPDLKRSQSSLRNKAVVMGIRHGIDRKARVRITCDPSRKTLHQAYAKSGKKTVTRPAREEGGSEFTGYSGSSLVGSKYQKSRKDLCTGTDDVCEHRCLQRRLGHSDERPPPFRSVDRRAIKMAYQQKGTLHSLSSFAGVPRGSSRSINNGSVRQQDSGVVFAKPGWYQVYRTARNDKRNLGLSSELKCNHSLVLPARPLQFNRRLLIQRKSPTRLAHQKRDHTEDISKMGSSSDRSLRLRPIESSTGLCLDRCKGHTSSLRECVQPNLELRTGVDFPPSTTCTSGTPTSEQVLRNISDRGTSMGDSVLEKRPQTQSPGCPVPDTELNREPNRLIHEPSSAEGRKSLFGGLEDTGWADLVAGLDQADVNLIQSAWRDSTWRTYESAWKQWVSWCRQNGRKPNSPRPLDVAAYLGSLSRVRKLAPSTIMVHKSVILTFADPTQEKQLGNHPVVAAMLKAIKIQKCMSAVPKTQIWNIQDLFQWLKSNIPDKESIFQVSRHVALLLLLASGRRIHDLTLLMIDDQHCERSDSSITFWPRFGSKTDNDRNRQSGWHLTCSGDMDLSLVKWINCLIDVTNSRRRAREGLNNLFITTRGEVKAASRTVIAGWLKAPFKDIGIDCSPGSVRSAVASNDFQNNVPLDDILKRGNWRGSTNFFKHYCKSVEQPRGRNVNVLNNSFNAV